MPYYPFFFLVVTSIGWVAGIVKGPQYALLTYVFIYFNIPATQWWGNYVPDLRWSYTSALIVLVSIFLHRRRILSNPLEKISGLRWLLFYLLWMLLTFKLSTDPNMAFTKVYEFFRYVVVFGFVVIIVDNANKLRVYLWVLLSQIAYLSWTARNYFTGLRLDGVGPGDAGGANELAILVLSFLPFFLVFLLKGKKWERIMALLCLPVVLNCFSMCRSRGGFLGIIVAMIVFFLLERQKRVRKKLFLLSIATVIALFFLSDASFQARLAEMFSGEDTNTTSSGRIENWGYGLKMAADYPLGAGGGSYMILSPDYLPTRLLEGNVGQRAAHNTFLLILVEQGFVGLIFFLFFLGRIAKTAFQAKQQIIFSNRMGKQHPDDILLYMFNNAALSGLAGLLVAGFFTDRLYYEGLYFLTAIFPVLYHINSEKFE